MGSELKPDERGLSPLQLLERYVGRISSDLAEAATTGLSYSKWTDYLPLLEHELNSTLCEEDSSSDESIEDEQLAEAEDIMVQAIENFIDEDSFFNLEEDK